LLIVPLSDRLTHSPV